MAFRDRKTNRTRRPARRLRFQSLENRRLLAAEVLPTYSQAQVSNEPAVLAASTTSEGEPAADLVEFAKLLAAAEVRFFGASWCADCTAQAQLFEDGWNELPFVEVTGSDREFNDVGIAEEIEFLPTWEFPDGSRFEGVLSLAEISARSGVDIPVGEAPSFETIEDQIVQIGSPLHIPIDAYDPNGDALTVTVSVDHPEAIEATVIAGNRSIRIDMDGFGDMVFQLFEQRAPRPAGRVIELAENDFYDDIILHRVIDNFMFQTGDPTGTGTSGSELGPFDDQFHPDLQHNRGGVLSFAKSADDTNNSQFFVTEVPTRHLDFNHSIFGQLVEGDEVREAISELDTIDPDSFPPNHMPVVEISMTTIDVFTDMENGVIMLKALGDSATTTSVTVTVTDSNGLASQQTFDVAIESDTANSPPFLEPLNVPSEIFVNQVLELQLTSFDIEGDVGVYNAARVGGDIDADVVIDNQTGVVTITPATDAEGTLVIGTLVEPVPSVFVGGQRVFDRQDFVISVVAAPPFHNIDDPTDVDGVGGPSALDALLIINAMFKNGGEIDLSSGDVVGLDPELNYNVNGDLKITALDALQVINAIASSEPEAVVPVRASPASRAAQIMYADHSRSNPISNARDEEREYLFALFAAYDLGLQNID